MGYDRTYTREEVNQMLYLSERRTRPSAGVNGHSGHPISRHTEQREDPFDRRSIAQDSTFASRKHLILAVEEALHDPLGQQALATMNSNGAASCSITVQLSATLGKIKANVVQSPMTKVGKKNVPTQGPQHFHQNVLVNSVFVLIDRLSAAEGWAPLHIQTAYPKDFLP